MRLLAARKQRHVFYSLLALACTCLIIVVLYFLLLRSSGGDNQVWQMSAPVASLLFSPDGSWIALGLDTGQVEVRQPNDSQLLHMLDQGSRITALATSADGTILASGDSNGSVHLWRVADGLSGGVQVDQSWGVRAMAFSADGRMLAANGDDGQINLWDTSQGRLLSTLSNVPAMTVNSTSYRALLFSQDGKRLLGADSDYSVLEWAVPGGTLLRKQEQRVAMANALAAVSLSRDGETVAMAPLGNEIYIWRLDASNSLQTLGSPGLLGFGWTGHKSDVASLEFSPDGQLLASGGAFCNACDFDAHDFSVRVWRVADSEQVAQFNGHTGDVLDLAWSPDGKLLASGSADSTVRLWPIK